MDASRIDRTTSQADALAVERTMFRWHEKVPDLEMLHIVGVAPDPDTNTATVFFCAHDEANDRTEVIAYPGLPAAEDQELPDPDHVAKHINHVLAAGWN